MSKVPFIHTSYNPEIVIVFKVNQHAIYEQTSATKLIYNATIFPRCNNIRPMQTTPIFNGRLK